MKMTDEIKQFILTWGELASHWGLNRTEACIHALLFISAQPLSMEEIAGHLHIARSHASNSLKELERWNIVKRVSKLGERMKQYTAQKDVWIMFHNIFNEQKRRNIDPFMHLLDETNVALAQKKTPNEEERHASVQIKEMAAFFDTTMAWYGQIEKMPLASVRRYLTLGRRFKKFMDKRLV